MAIIYIIWTILINKTRIKINWHKIMVKLNSKTKQIIVFSRINYYPWIFTLNQKDNISNWPNKVSKAE